MFLAEVKKAVGASDLIQHLISLLEALMLDLSLDRYSSTLLVNKIRSNIEVLSSTRLFKDDTQHLIGVHMVQLVRFLDLYWPPRHGIGWQYRVMGIPVGLNRHGIKLIEEALEFLDALKHFKVGDVNR